MSETGFTSLILAAAGGHVEVVKTLVEKVMNAMDTVRRSHDQFREACFHRWSLRKDGQQL